MNFQNKTHLVDADFNLCLYPEPFVVLYGELLPLIIREWNKAASEITR